MTKNHNDTNIKEKLRQALISTVKVISEDFRKDIEIKNEKVTKELDFIDLDNDADVITWGTFISIRALYGRSAQLYYQLQTMEHAIIYEKDSIPIEYHYTFNDRIPDIVIIAEEGWYITSRERGNMDYKTGDHGYIPSNPSMSSFLLASGDIFVEGYESNTIIENIHLYSLMGKILNIGVAPNNGTWVSLCPLLNNQC